MKTKEEIINQFENFFFIDINTLAPIPERILIIEKDENPETKIKNVAGLIWEQKEMLKLKTVERWLQMKEGFNKNQYRHLITLESQKTDELGLIGNLGSKMTNEEFDLYVEVYNQLFELV